jgi:hypothetical protein
LKTCSHLANMPRITSVVLISSYKKHRRVVHAIPHLVVRRVVVKRMEFVGIGDCAVFASPSHRPIEKFIPNHVEQRSDAYRCPKKFWALRRRCSYRQTGMRINVRLQALEGRLVLTTHLLRRSKEIADRCLPPGPSASLMPGFAILTSPRMCGTAKVAPSPSMTATSTENRGVDGRPNPL